MYHCDGSHVLASLRHDCSPQPPPHEEAAVVIVFVAHLWRHCCMPHVYQWTRIDWLASALRVSAAPHFLKLSPWFNRRPETLLWFPAHSPHSPVVWTDLWADMPSSKGTFQPWRLTWADIGRWLWNEHGCSNVSRFDCAVVDLFCVSGYHRLWRGVQLNTCDKVNLSTDRGMFCTGLTECFYPQHKGPYVFFCLMAWCQGFCPLSHLPLMKIFSSCPMGCIAGYGHFAVLFACSNMLCFWGWTQLEPARDRPLKLLFCVLISLNWWVYSVDTDPWANVRP